MQLVQAWGVQQLLDNSMPLPCDAVLVFCHTYPLRLCSAPSHQYSSNVVQSQTSLICLSAQQAQIMYAICRTQKLIMPSAGSTVSASKAAYVTRAELDMSGHIGWQNATNRMNHAAGRPPHCVLMAKGQAMLTVNIVVLLGHIGMQ